MNLSFCLFNHSMLDMRITYKYAFMYGPDAAAGAGSDETERGQPDSSSSDRPQEEEEDSRLAIVHFCS